jgi:hypothetical protein
MEIMSENIFSKSSTARAKDQEMKMAANDLIDKNAQKIRVNFSLSSESNEKMRKKAEEMGLSKSALLQLWIHQNCD